MTEYRWRSSFAAHSVAADAAAIELERIRAAHDEEKLDPHAIVEASRSKKAVLHPLFEWDDAVAGEEYRLQQARRLSRSIYVITPATETEPEREAPIYFHVEPNNYQPADVVVAHADLFEQALEALQRRMSAAERAVRELEEVAKRGDHPDRLAAIALAVNGFEAVRAAIAIIR